jgi:hypothetical protein
MDQARFEAAVAQAIADFEGPRNAVLTTLRAGRATRTDYHAILCRLFHQVRSSSSTFALAGARMEPARFAAQHYLFRHAQEEATHWQWILSDLRSTGYRGTDPAELLPDTATEAYVAYNHYIAASFPLGRLAIASVLEGIGAALGTTYGTRLARALQLAPDQMVFFAGHGETDVLHSAELRQVLADAAPTPAEWERLAAIARSAGRLYTMLYAADG